MQSRKLSRYAFMAAILLGFAMTASYLDAQRAAAPQAPVERAQARSMVITQDGIVAAESPLAAQAGVEILKRGGNAVDAAIAANAVMGVVAPMSNGIGGDLFVIYYDAKSGKLYGLNASGPAPAALNAQLLRDKKIVEMPLRGIYSVTVPGAVDGWAKLLERFGTKKFPEVLAPAIHVADQGFPVTEWISSLWINNADVLRKNDEATRVYLNNDQAPRVGQVFRNPDLANSLKLIASGGRDAFYKGELAHKFVQLSQKEDGVMTLNDLAAYSSEWVEPISTTYRGWTVSELPPNGQGIAALEMLNIMETFPLQQVASAPGQPATPPQFPLNQTRTLHMMIEAKKLAYADLKKYIGEPKNNPAVMQAAMAMLEKSYAAERAKLIDMDKANCAVEAGTPLRPGGDTIYLSTVDREGNMVSLIQSNYENFGSGLVAPGTGFVLPRSRRALPDLEDRFAKRSRRRQASVTHHHSSVHVSG